MLPPRSSRANPAAQPRLGVGDTKSRAQGSRPGSQGCGASSGEVRTPRSSSTSWSCNPKSPSASILNYHQPQQRGLPELPHTSAAEHLLLAREHAGSFPAEGRRTISSRSFLFPGRSSLGFSHSNADKQLYTQQQSLTQPGNTWSEPASTREMNQVMGTEKQSQRVHQFSDFITSPQSPLS